MILRTLRAHWARGAAGVLDGTLSSIRVALQYSQPTASFTPPARCDAALDLGEVADWRSFAVTLERAGHP
jgi:hypothetical protein